MFKIDKDYKLKIGLAEMLKGGVIMDVTTADQAKIAEDAKGTAAYSIVYEYMDSTPVADDPFLELDPPPPKR